MFRQAFFSTLLCLTLVSLHAQLEEEPVASCTGINWIIWVSISFVGSNLKATAMVSCRAFSQGTDIGTLYFSCPFCTPGQHPGTVICLSVGNPVLHWNFHFWSWVQCRSRRAELCQWWLLPADAVLNTDESSELRYISNVRKQPILNFAISALPSCNVEEMI